ncbi:MAG: acyltransferase [Verrucomicrobiales bacterium]|jgi:peptidoglycan/LPS O-acetylase OafA/YrhL|nr:acyltransferase [Verrucomicrobiales bacterium]
MRRRIEITNLTALRFFAALLVFIDHFTMLPGPNRFEYVRDCGAVGVSVFFVLSGFILTYNYIDLDWQNRFRFSAKEFYIARVGRIYPLHFLAALFALPLALNSITARLIPAALPAHLALVNMFFPIKQLGAPPNKVAWTLSCEVFFYLLTPMLFWFLNKFSISRRGFGVGVSFWILGEVILFNAIPDWQPYFHNYGVFRFCDYLVGVWLCLLFTEKKGMRLGGGMVFLAISLIAVAQMLPSAAATFVPIAILWLPGAALIVLALACFDGGVNKVLARPLLLLLGNASFALYLFHEAAFRYLKVLLDMKRIVLSGALMVLVFLITFLIFQFGAVWLHKRYEVPLQRWTKARLGKIFLG